VASCYQVACSRHQSTTRPLLLARSATQLIWD